MVKLFWFWDYVPDIDVKLFNSTATAKTKIELTDIDVLGFKIGPELRPQKIAADCKTVKKMSPINRAFWLSGVMGTLDISRGFVVLSRTIEVDHKLAGQQLGITLLSEDDFTVLEKSLLPAYFPHQLNLFKADVWQKFFVEAQEQGQISRLWEYRRNRFWQDTPQHGLRNTLMELRSHRRVFDQKNRIHTAVFLDVVTAFSIALSQMLTELFQVYLHPETKDELDQRMKAYVYGGRGTYETLNNLALRVAQLRSQLSQGSAPHVEAPSTKDALALPEWELFMQLFRTALDAPSHFFVVPKVLRYVLFEKLLPPASDVDIVDAIPNVSSHSIKFALDLLRYVVDATMMPEYVWRPIQDVLDEALLRIPSAASRRRLQLEVPSKPSSGQSDS